jgi:hypothetical protein
MFVATAWMSRVSLHTGYFTAIAPPMIIFGVGQGLGLSSLTAAGMAGVADRDAGIAGGLINVAHHLGGALGLGVLITVFTAAGAGAHGARDLLAQRVSASLTAATVFLVLALAVMLIARPRRAARTHDGVPDAPADMTDPVPAAAVAEALIQPSTPA